ncbi:MAG: hypothetical protein WBE86_04525 [Candidatus Acidiferrales bacterium]
MQKRQAALLRALGALWHDAAMTTRKKKISKFDKVALEIAEGIANIPIKGKKEAAHLLHDIESKGEAPERTKKLPAKIRTEVKKKFSGAKSTRTRK